MSAETTWINGEAASAISVADRGMQYGDGVFETMRLHNGELPLWPYHWQRLHNSCQRLSIPLPGKAEVEACLAPAITAHQQGIIKLLVTRGAGGRGYGFHQGMLPSIVVMYFEPPGADRQGLASEGVRTRLCHTRLSLQPLLAGIKHLNRLEQVMARSEWNDEVQEGLMCNQKGELVEATMSNLFMVKNATLFTPLLKDCGVSGVMREVVITLARQLSINCEETILLPEQLPEMDEVFLTNSVNGIWPVIEFEKAQYKIGPVTQRLQTELQQRFAY